MVKLQAGTGHKCDPPGQGSQERGADELQARNRNPLLQLVGGFGADRA